MIEKKMKDLAWNTFKQTGDINTFMELIQVENIQKNKIQNNLENIEETQNGNNQNQGNYPFGK